MSSVRKSERIVKRKASAPAVCFVCARRAAIVPGHKVCEDCHALRGRCGHCGYTR